MKNDTSQWTMLYPSVHSNVQYMYYIRMYNTISSMYNTIMNPIYNAIGHIQSLVLTDASNAVTVNM